MASTPSLNRRTIGPSAPRFRIEEDSLPPVEEKKEEEKSGEFHPTPTSFTAPPPPQEEEAIPFTVTETGVPYVEPAPKKRGNIIVTEEDRLTLKDNFIELLKQYPKSGFEMPPDSMPYDLALETYRKYHAKAKKLSSDLKAKFTVYQCNNPNIEVEIPPDELPFDERQEIYNEYISNSIASMNAEEYKMYLIVVFAIIEFLCCNYLNLDIKGYTKLQWHTMNRYQKLLMEMGHENIGSGPSTTPPYLRIAGMALFQAVTFLIIKFLSKQIGENMLINKLHTLSGTMAERMAGGENGGKRDEDGFVEQSEDPGVGNLLGEAANTLLGDGLNIGNLLGGLTNMFGGANVPPKKEAPKPKRRFGGSS